MSTDLANIVRAAIPPGELDAAQALAWVRGALATYRREKRGAPSPSISAQRTELKKAVGYADKLSACLERLTPEVAIRLSPRMGDTDVVQYRATVEKLKQHTEQAYKALATASRNKPKDAALDELLGSLVIVWCQSHPRQNGVTRGSRGSDTHQYDGKLLEFVHAVLSAEKVPHTRSGLGKRLYYRLPWKSERRAPNTR